jgi:ammonia channel protein AmtB
MISCLILKKVKFDDPLENFAIYGSAGFWSMLASAFFIPYEGILWSSSSSGSILGV